MKKPVSLIVAVLLGVVALMHLLRFILHVEVIVRGWPVPPWVSVPGFLVPAALAALLWRERNRTE